MLWREIRTANYAPRRADKIRIANPGAFRINVQEALVGGVSDPRNESLIKMFNLINVGERAGSGLPSIRSVWQRQGWQEPEIVEAFNPDRTTFCCRLRRKKRRQKMAVKKWRKIKHHCRTPQSGYFTVPDRHS